MTFSKFLEYESIFIAVFVPAKWDWPSQIVTNTESNVEFKIELSPEQVKGNLPLWRAILVATAPITHVLFCWTLLTGAILLLSVGLF